MPIRLHLLKVAAAGLVSLLLLPATSRAVLIATTGTYNDAGVNSSATPAPNDLATFDAAVGVAFTAGTGGVVNFDLGADTAGSTVEATYAGGAKTLNVTSSDAFSIQTFTGSTPLSGRAMLVPSANDGNDDATLTLGPITGGFVDEAVTRVGFTLLSRVTGGPYTQSIAVTAFFSNATSQTVSDTINESNGGDDTFFGFTAPAGTSITSIGFNPPLDAQDSRLVVDDFGFTTAAVPEPSTAALVLLAGGLALARRRGRRGA